MAKRGAGLGGAYRKAYQAYQRDGLLDVILALGILGFVLMILLGELACLGLTWAALFLYLPIKTRLILPRLENEGTEPTTIQAVRQARHVALSVLLTIIILESLILFASEFYLPAQVWFESNLWRLLGGLLALSLASIGIGVGLWRLAVYGGLALILVSIQDSFSLPVYLPFLVLGVICGISGAVQLSVFLRNISLAESARPFMAPKNQPPRLPINQTTSD